MKITPRDSIYDPGDQNKSLMSSYYSLREEDRDFSNHQRPQFDSFYERGKYDTYRPPEEAEDMIMPAQPSPILSPGRNRSISEILSSMVKNNKPKYNPEGKGPDGRVTQLPEVGNKNHSQGFTRQTEVYSNPDFNNYTPGYHKLIPLALLTSEDERSPFFQRSKLFWFKNYKNDMN